MNDYTEPVAVCAGVVRAEAAETSEHEWGRIIFFASDAVGSATEQSVGRCEINPGAALPRHYHTKCSEVVHVLQGTIKHTVEGSRMETLRAGDTVIIPRNFVHQAINVGEEQAVLLISFSAPKRDFITI